MKKNIEKKSRFCIFTCFICFITTISQTPTFVDNFPTRNIIIPIWLVFAIYCILKNPVIYVGKAKSVMAIAALFAGYYLLGVIFIQAYQKSNIPYVFFLSVFILITGLLAGRYLDSYDIEYLSTVYIVSGTLVCIDTFITYIYGNSFVGRVYVYDSKNSVSQILITTWILILIFKFRKDSLRIKKIMYLLIFILLSVTLVGLKSRATLISIPIVIIWIIIHGNLDKRLRNTIILVIGILLIVLLTNPAILDDFINNIVYSGRNINDLNDISSGRFEEWITFWDDFVKAPFWGYGRMKRESLILTSLLEFGMIGGILVLLFAIWPLYWAFKYMNKYNRNYLMFSSIAIIYVLNGIFEQLAPFGPGVKCYFLWFMLGVLISMRADKRKNC